MKYLVTALIILFTTPLFLFAQDAPLIGSDFSGTIPTNTEEIVEPVEEETSSTSTEETLIPNDDVSTTTEATVAVEEEVEPELTEEEKQNLFDELKRILFAALTIQLSQVSDIDAKTCPVLDNNLYIGDVGSDVTKLQVFLKELGTSVYPEGEVTGKYGSLTKRAVERFQVKTGIFGPGQAGYGVTGPVTRKTISEYCQTNSLDEPTVEAAPVVIIPTQSVVTETPNFSGVTISSSVSGDSQIQNSTLFNPNSSSVFLQYLNPSEIQTPTENLNSTNTNVALTPPSPVSKTMRFTSTPAEVMVGSSYTIAFTQSGFSGFDLVSLEGYKDDTQYFFGSTVPALGTYQITIPDVFKDKDSFTLIVKHNNDIKDSRTISVVTEIEPATE